jgi:hypothetical protein
MSRRTVVVAIALAVALAVAGLFAAGVTPDGTPLSEGSDADTPNADDPPTDGEDGGEDTTTPGNGEGETDSGSNETRKLSDGSDDGDQPPDEGGETDDAASENGTQEKTDTEVGNDDADESATGVETADVPVEIYAVDRGPVAEGEMHLYNTTSGARVASHDFAEGHRTVFENLTRKTTFDIVVNVSYYPDETITFSPRISDAVNETIGYEFRGAETYEMEWEVDELPTNVDYDDENAERKAITQKGYSVFDGEGNYYSTWSPSMFDASYDYLHVAANNQSYMNAAVEDAEWKQIEAYWGDPSTSREIVTRSGLSDLHEREFVEEKEVISAERNEVHVYRVNAPQTGSPLTVHVDPKTGYVVYVEVHAAKINDPGFLRDVSEITSHNEELDAIPEDFPAEEINNIPESE